MKYIATNISDNWLKATVLGSIWASNEIVLGSFLHNLKIPLSGSIMSFLSVIILVSFCELWKNKQIVWRAGLIAALMKSISPSALILGPMVGILMEALMLSFGILLLGRNLLGYILGGSLATSVVLFQKVGRLLLIYSFDLVKIFNNLFDYISKQLHFNNNSVFIIIISILAIYFFVGIIAAIIGFIIGKNSTTFRSDYSHFKKFEIHKGNLLKKPDKNRFSLLLLYSNILAIVTGMYLINTSSVWLVILFIAIYFSFAIIKYKNALQNLKKPLFWAWFVAVTFFASYFLGNWQSKLGFNILGLKTGLFMNLRAALIIIGFVAISTELKNPVIKSVMYKRGAASLYQSLELAFGILPAIIEILPAPKYIIHHPFKSIIGLLNSANYMLEHVKSYYTKHPLLIITGEIQQGKTSFLKEIVTQLKLKGIYPTGFLSEVILERDKRTGYKITSITTGRSNILCKNSPNPNRINYGQFYFYKEAFEFGKKIIIESIYSNSPLIIIDEIGPLEINDEGWAEAINDVCNNSAIPMLWVVRKSLVEKAAKKWGFSDIVIVDIGEENAKIKVDNYLELVHKLTHFLN